MPGKANQARRHMIAQARDKVADWPEYAGALQQRGTLTVSGEPAALAAWRQPHTGQRGRPRNDAGVAIETGPLLRLAVSRPWRQTEALLRSIAALLGDDVGGPDPATSSPSSPGLAPAAALAQA